MSVEGRERSRVVVSQNFGVVVRQAKVTRGAGTSLTRAREQKAQRRCALGSEASRGSEEDQWWFDLIREGG